MAMKKWVVGKADVQTAKLLAEDCGIDAFAALVACGRGITDSAELELMLSNEPLMCDPKELVDISAAAECINKAIADGTYIAIYGDYDCDGVVATTILYDYLLSRGAKVTYYIPDRVEEGYGMNITAVGKLADMGVGLIITVDNGISCAEEIDYANSMGIKTVVTDHHLPPEVLPEAVAVVDPHRKDCMSSFKEICGAMVAFKLICVLDDKEPEQLLPRYADLVSIATIADVMPLINENRSIVKEGVRMIRRLPRTGIGALLSVSGVERNALTAGKLSFSVVPRINAAGRMGSAARAVELLLKTDMLSALGIANEIDAENANRQQIEKQITSEACSLIEENGYQHNRVIVVAGENWHSGIVGIVASRICEKYGRPAIVLSIQDDMAHGSGRSFSGFHLYNAINACSEGLEKYGGHELAAGVSVLAERIDEFRKNINAYARTVELAVPQLKLDFRINPAGMSVDMAHVLKTLEPYGFGNPTPVFGIFGVKLERITPLSAGKHLRLLFSKDAATFQALLFGVTPEKFCFDIGDTLDLAVMLEVNLYRDEYNLSVQIKAIRITDTDEDRVFYELSCLDDYKSGLDTDFAALFPTREQVGEVYRYINGGAVTEEKMRYAKLKTLGIAKTQLAVDTLCELGLVINEDGILKADATAPKTDLMNSKTYRLLYERVKT